MKPIVLTAAITILVGSIVSRQGNKVNSLLFQPEPTGVGRCSIANNTTPCNVSGENALSAAGTLAQIPTLYNTFTSLLPRCVPVSSGRARKYLGSGGPLSEQIVA